MKYRVVVVDDEKPARERVKRLLTSYEDFEVVGEAADAPGAVETIDRLEPDVCFVDVRMPEGDGFEVLEEVEHVPLFVFTTAYDEYAVRAFDVRSTDYLMKPFSRKRFGEAIERLRERLARGAEEPDSAEPGAKGPESGADAPPRISGKRGAKILVLEPGEILWFEAEDTLVFAHTASGRVMIDRTLSELETNLGRTFFRCHRRFLVNLARIAEILPGDAGTYRIVLRDEGRSTVPLSRRQARRLREIIPW